MKHKDFALGFFFLILQAIIIFAIKDLDYSTLFWFCNHAPLFFSIGFFLKKYQLIKGIITVGILAQIIWIIDLLYYITTSNFLFNVTNYVADLQGFSLIITIMVHVFSTLLALIFTFEEKIKKQSLTYTSVYGVLLYFSTLMFSSPEDNINCVFELCSFQSLELTHYTFIFPILAILVLIIPGYLIQKYLFKLIKSS